jgi:hypothetical protein
VGIHVTAAPVLMIQRPRCSLLFLQIWKKCNEGDWRTASKGLYVLHRLLRDCGSDDDAEALALEFRRFSSKALVNGDHHPTIAPTLAQPAFRPRTLSRNSCCMSCVRGTRAPCDVTSLSWCRGRPPGAPRGPLAGGGGP